MKPVIFHWCPNSILGGVEAAVLTYIEAASDFEHVIFTGNPQGQMISKWKLAGAEVNVVSEWNVSSRRWASHWRKTIRAVSPLYFIAWSPSRLPLLLSPLPKETKCLVHIGNCFRNPWKIRWGFLFQHFWFGCKVSPILVACSESAKEVTINTCPYLGRFKSVIIPNAARADFFKQSDYTPVFSPIWGMVSRLDKIKNHRLLIQAVPLILEKEPDFILELVGDGDLRRVIEEDVISFGVQHAVRMIGASSDIPFYFNRWQGFVFSTTVAEGFGIALVEAMASGLPCVVTDIPVMHSIGRDGVLYAAATPGEFARQILYLIGSEPTRNKFSIMGREVAMANYSPAAFALAYSTQLGLF